jgi:hypothetical protein
VHPRYYGMAEVTNSFGNKFASWQLAVILTCNLLLSHHHSFIESKESKQNEVRNLLRLLPVQSGCQYSLGICQITLLPSKHPTHNKSLKHRILKSASFDHASKTMTLY